MITAINKLVEVGGKSFVADKVNSNGGLDQYPELLELLQSKNGFFAFESALRVFPSQASNESYGLSEWNSKNLWRNHYGNLMKDYFFFAEDIFGGQFCYFDSKIYQFDPETGEAIFMADSLEEWAKKILENYNVLTGYQLAHDWQTKHGQLAYKKRLLPTKLFVLGGEYNSENLGDVDSVEAMQFRGSVAQQIKDLPDGTQINFSIKDWEPISKEN